MVKVLALFSGSLASRVAARLVANHPQVSSVQLLHFRSPFSRESDELRQFARSEWSHATFRTQSVKKDYQDLIALTDDGEFSLSGSCRSCQSLLLSKAAKYMARIGADYLVTGSIPDLHGLAGQDAADIASAEGLEGRILRPLLVEQPLRIPSHLDSWADMSRHTSEPEAIARRLPRLAEKLGLCPMDPLSSECRCRLMTPGFGERVAALFKEEVVTLNALCLLDFPMYIMADPDLQVVLAFDENEKRELQNYFLPQDLRLYPATPHGPMTLLRTNWDTKCDSEKQDIVEFVARLTATYVRMHDTATVPIYYRMESGDERQLLNVEPFTSIEELEKRKDLTWIPLDLPAERIYAA